MEKILQFIDSLQAQSFIAILVITVIFLVAGLSLLNDFFKFLIGLFYGRKKS